MILLLSPGGATVIRELHLSAEATKNANSQIKVDSHNAAA